MKSEKVKSKTKKENKMGTKPDQNKAELEKQREEAINECVLLELGSEYQTQKYAAILATLNTAAVMGYIPGDALKTQDFRERFFVEFIKVYPYFVDFVVRREPPFAEDKKKEVK